MNNQQYAGRMYQNPNKKEELWVNTGSSYFKGRQEYPKYEPTLSPHITEEAYKQIISVVKEQFEETPVFVPCLSWCACFLCLFTGGIFFCPLCIVQKMKLKLKKKQVEKEVENAGQAIKIEVRFEMKINGSVEEKQGDWIDSKGQILEIKSTYGKGSKHRARTIGGPPLGGNIIFTLPETITWPPSNSTDENISDENDECDDVSELV